MKKNARMYSALAGLALAFPLVPSLVIAEEATPPVADTHYKSFFSDRQAFRKGDMLTVMITESAVASSSARTRADKSDRISASVAHLPPNSNGITVGANNQFDGGGEIQRTGRLLAKLTVVVDHIDDNGNLVVAGEQNIAINNEQQRIALHGTIRTEDIAPDNTVPSWRIFGAQIEFKGKGILASKQSPGLLAKLFDLFGLN
jgi:flagellar L-ring protein precursor FlgH